MAKLTLLTLSSLIHLVNIDGLYLIGYAWLFGMCEFPGTPSWIFFVLIEVKLFGLHFLEVRTDSLHLVYLFNLRHIAGVIAYQNLRKPLAWSSCTVAKCQWYSPYSSTTLQCIAAQDIPNILCAFDTSLLWSPLLMGPQPSRRSHSHLPAKCRWCCPGVYTWCGTGLPGTQLFCCWSID